MSLLPRPAVDTLAQEIGVAIVAGILLDHVNHDPAQRDRLPIPVTRATCRLIKRRYGGDVPPGGLAGLLPSLHDLLNAMPVKISPEILTLVQVNGRIRCTQDNDIKPIVLNLGEVTEQPQQGERRRWRYRCL